MKCATVKSNLAGYLDDAIVSAASPMQRVQIRKHLEICADCREELQRYRKLSQLMASVPRSVPPADLAIRIKVAAAQMRPAMTWKQRVASMRDRMEILSENVFRPLTVPATGGFFSAILVFVVMLHMMVPGISVRSTGGEVVRS